jgi:Xaa-Pro aminopeptidase
MAGEYSETEANLMGNSFHEARQKNARKILDSHALDGILFTGLENIRYLCGFTGSDGALIITQKESFFLTDSRYWTQADEEVKGSRIIRYKKKMEGIFSLLFELKLKEIGFESALLPFLAYQFLAERLGNETRLNPLEEALRNLRAVKDAHELTLLRRAIDISSNAFLQVAEILKEGVVEREAALEMESIMKRSGADALGFDIILASGKRSALPHGKASEKRIEKGDFILVDFGSGFQGYHSDQTRTLVCGRPSAEQQKVYRIVKEAHDKAVEKVRPGIPVGEVDGAARDHIRNQGYGEYFGHGTGHGIGLAVHEDPTVNSENKGFLQEGMVFTIEPGIYLPDWGGVRIEDMVLVTPQGVEVLTHLPNELNAV